MNLSALNNLPANSPSSKLAEPSGSSMDSARLKSEALKGADFASFLHNQVQALRNVQRPDIAASAKGLPPASSAHADKQTDRVKTSAGTDKAPDNEATAANRKKTAGKVQDADRKEANDKDNITQNQKGEKSKASKAAEEDRGMQQDADQVTRAEDSQAKQDVSTQNVADSTEVSLDAQQTNAGEQADHAELLADQATALTTIAVSDKLQIITTTQTAASEQSVADFALAMGLDPGQVKTLFGESAANAANAKLTNTNTSTQQMLGMNTLPSFFSANQSGQAAAGSQFTTVSANAMATDALPLSLNTPVTTADFQELNTQISTADESQQALLGKMENLQIQIGTAQAQMTTATPQPVSTLAVLSMMDAQLRSEDIESLKNEFDAIGPLGSTSSTLNEVAAAPLPGLPNRNSPNHAAAPVAQAFANNPDMAQTYDKLSQKLTTELAARMHEKLNAGEWKMKFALKPASLGLVDVQLEMKDGKLSAHFQSDTNLTQDLLQNGSQRLKDALADLGMNNASVFVAQGETQRQSGQNSSQLSGGRSQPDDNREKLSEESGLKIAEDSLPRRSSSSQFDSYA